MTQERTDERIDGLLAELGPADPPPELAGQVMARVALHRRHDRTRSGQLGHGGAI
jgi:hypothetical protein